MRLPTKSIERALLIKGHNCIVALDEVGMACLAGPAVVCAALFRPKFFRRRWRGLEYLRDSKLLLSHHRERFAAELSGHRYISHAISTVYPKEIDRLNIYQASRTAMRRAIRRLRLKKSDKPFILVDGNKLLEGIVWPQRAIVKGDRKVFSIAAASVLAKVYRDAMMVRYAKRYPGYGLEVHKGYPTRLHQQRLIELGPCVVHRKSFKLTY